MNPIAEIVATTIRDEECCGLTVNDEHVFCDDARAESRCDECGCKNVARAIITALEAAGYKVMAREPTEEMVKKAIAAFNGKGIYSVSKAIRTALLAAHDAAPRYGEPSK